MTMNELDYRLFHMINEQAALHPALNGLMSFLAQDAQYLFALGLLVYWFTRSDTNRRMVIQAAVAACIGLGISFILGHLFYRDRPFAAHAVIQLIKHPANASFPSDHAIATFALAAAFVLNRGRMRWVWLLLAAVISFSRVYTGVHYPTDVLAGALVGILSAAGVYVLLQYSRSIHRGVSALIHFYEAIELKIWKDRSASANSE
ncbi:undecaprenyl-diphosphatase [Paenibacillus sp. JX-17]|uniref:Undecaprenyl-diphosphatase n=1 Tax=Paenibacillus lacisoli TaxID=3064525 RepID=A0ABT9CDY0_9BACL|nr:undecaprenyl-diphosphatase [Paenibacillus sp. JX-17]MDO7907475.1 undecaprenyl-diphosphatase [Paenibacillus sp. JX-17]